MSKSKKTLVELTPAELDAVIYAVGNFTVGDKEDCGGNLQRLRAMHRAERKLFCAFAGTIPKNIIQQYEDKGDWTAQDAAGAHDGGGPT